MHNLKTIHWTSFTEWLPTITSFSASEFCQQPALNDNHAPSSSFNSSLCKGSCNIKQLNWLWGIKVGHSSFQWVTLKMHSTRLVLTHPKVYPPPPPNHDHAVARASQPFCWKLPRPVLLILLWIMGRFWVSFFLFLFNNFRNPGKTLPHFGRESFYIFKLTRGTRIDQKQFACNIVEHVVDRGLLLQWKILVLKDLKPQEITIEALTSYLK